MLFRAEFWNLDYRDINHSKGLTSSTDFFFYVCFVNEEIIQIQHDASVFSKRLLCQQEYSTEREEKKKKNASVTAMTKKFQMALNVI